MAKPKRPTKSKAKRRGTAIVPRVVFSTVVATAVVPSLGLGVAGCYYDSGVAARAYDAAGPVDAARTDSGFSMADAGFFSVALPIDAGPDVGPADTGFFSVADSSIPVDSGLFGVAAPLDSGTFGVAAPPPDGST